MAIDDNEIYEVFAVDPNRGFRMLMTAYSKPIYAYVRRLVVRHDDAEDVCQEIFIRVFRNWKKFKRESALSTWIYKIATREAVRFLHKQAEKEAAAMPDVKFTPQQIKDYTTVGGTPFLDNEYTVFGEVIDGMEVIDRIQQVATDRNDRPKEDVRIVEMTVID